MHEVLSLENQRSMGRRRQKEGRRVEKMEEGYEEEREDKEDEEGKWVT